MEVLYHLKHQIKNFVVDYIALLVHLPPFLYRLLDYLRSFCLHDLVHLITHHTPLQSKLFSQHQENQVEHKKRNEQVHPYFAYPIEQG